MKSIDFPEANLALAKDQPEYQTLYVFFNRLASPFFPMTCCFELDEKEIEQIVKTKRLFFTQSTFGRGYSPINMNLENPFLAEHDNLPPPMDENRVAADLWDATHFVPEDPRVQPVDAEYFYQVPCLNCGQPEVKHFWSTRQCVI